MILYYTPLAGSQPVHPSRATAGRPVTHGVPLEVAVVLNASQPADEAAARVAQFATAHALEVMEVSTRRGDVILSGESGAFQAAFKIVRRHYAHGSATYQGHDEAVHLPTELHPWVDGVLGLDNIPCAQPHAAVGPSPAASSLTPQALASHYRFPPVTGAAQARVALLEFGGGIDLDDVREYLRSHDIRGRDPDLFFVRDGSAHAPGNEPLARAPSRAIISDWRAGTSFADMATRHGPALGAFMETLEVTMDAEIIAAMAPGIPVDIYFASSGADGWRRAICAAMGAPYAGSLPGQQSPLPATTISISWGQSEQEWGPMKLRLLHRALELAAREGVTVCCSTGDFGSRNSPRPGAPLQVNFPASSPAVIACGGTSVVRSGREIVDEVAWHESLLGSEMASGGGMSGFFPVPDFQARVRTPDPKGTWLATGGADFRGRWTPDVSALAGFAHGLEVLVAGERMSAGGTSAATPIWAALCARLAAITQRRLGAMGPALYALEGSAALRPVTSGTNDLFPHAGSAPHWTATGGWNPCAGLGVPDGESLLASLHGEHPSSATGPRH